MVVTTSDAEGKFSLRGFPPNTKFQFIASKAGYVTINWVVRVADDGIRWYEAGGDGTTFGPTDQLTVLMGRVAWIEGQALDAETGEPVQLDKVVRCNFEHGPDGKPVLSGCRIPRFEQPETGRFRVEYSHPHEYHLTFSAAGYHDAEAITPKVTELKNVKGIIVKLKRQKAGSKPEVPRQRIEGTVTRHGRPVEVGWVGLWRLSQWDLVSVALMRGRTVVEPPIVYRNAPLRDGDYVLYVPFQDEAWYVVVEEPDQPLTQLGPIPIDRNQTKRLDIACSEGGSIRGT